MKISDTIYRFPVKGRRKDGLCRMRVFCNNQHNIIVVLTDLLDKNTSASVTNSIEVIIDSLIQNSIVPENSKFIEHYEDYGSFRESFDLVILNEEKPTDWKTLKKSEVIELINSDNSDEYEFDDFTLNNSRLLNEIERLRAEIAPYIDLPFPENNLILKKIIEIEDNQISKASIIKLIEDRANETEFQKLLKKDLSIFAELYAQPKDDYICFSEFPINNGFVDFVLITGISRMDVFLIEVKGAEFNLFNQSHYDKFSSKIETAMHQIRERLRYITENLRSFKKEIHMIRESVESGKKLYNSFMGPCTHLEVDEEKDINLYPIVIGGRTINDLEESRKRHDYEDNSRLRIKVESWDTWIRKLRRQ